MGVHPFRVQTTPNGSVGTQYNAGITNNDVVNGTLIWNVQFDAPNTLYYQCTSHSSMGGSFYIVDNGAIAAYNLADAALPKTGGTLTGNIVLDNQFDARFREATANGTNYVGFQAPAAIGTDVLWTLPATDGTAGQALVTNGSAVLSWAAAGGSSVIVESQQVISQNYTLTAGYNGMTAGPVEVAATFSVTVPANAIWLIL
jgi:hypothetical protein